MDSRYTDIEESVLLSKHGAFAKTSDAYYVVTMLDGKLIKSVFVDRKAAVFDEHTFAAWSLSALIGITPKRIIDRSGSIYTLVMTLNRDGVLWKVEYVNKDNGTVWSTHYGESLIRALVKAYCGTTNALIEESISIVTEDVEYRENKGTVSEES